MASLLEIASEHLPSEVTSEFIMNQMAVVKINSFGLYFNHFFPKLTQTEAMDLQHVF